jgi:hypothetical protein
MLFFQTKTTHPNFICKVSNFSTLRIHFFIQVLFEKLATGSDLQSSIKSFLRPSTIVPKVRIARAAMNKMVIEIFILENIW